jgi:peptidoglycan/LPS O-acetylase OafA/YrhL
MTGSATRKLNPLTSIRFLAASGVAGGHMFMTFSGKQEQTTMAWEQMVSLFFVLSGFILAYVYSTPLKLDRGRFFLARFARIWPAHVVALLFIWLALPSIIWPQFTFAKLAANLALVHTWVPSPEYWLSFAPASWSISTELGFYLCFPFLIYQLERTWAWKLIGSFVLLVGVILLMKAEQAHLFRWMGPNWRYWLYVHPLSRLFEFTLGLATFQLWRRFAPKIRAGLVVATIGEGLALGFLFLTMTHARMWEAQVSGSGFFCSELVGLWLLTSSSCLGCAGLIFVLALERGLFARLLSYPFLVLLGELSYTIYLIHQPVMVFYWGRRHDFAMFPLWAASGLIALFILALAYFIWAVIERPCRHFLVNLSPKPDNAAAVELPASMISPEGVISSSSAQIVLPSKRGILIASSILLTLLTLVICLSSAR